MDIMHIQACSRCSSCTEESSPQCGYESVPKATICDLLAYIHDNATMYHVLSFV